MGKVLILIGIILILVGLFIELGPRIPFLGKLPGDIIVEKENFRIYVPITTSLIISILLSIIFYLIKWLKP